MKAWGFKEWWARLAGAGVARKMARRLGGSEAQGRLLAELGYGGNPAGLAARVALELGRALPLADGPAGLRAFGRHLPGREVMAEARAEALSPYPQPEAPPQPASALRLDAGEEAALWPWTSGQRVCRLARASRLAGEAELARAAAESLAEFCRRNPPLLGPGWREGFTVAVRAASWLWAWRFLGQAFPAEQTATVLVHLRLMSQLLAQALEADQRPGPLQAGPAGALVLLGRALTVLPEAEAWRELGAARLGPALAAWQEPGPALPTHQAVAACEWGGLSLWLGSREGWELPGVVGGLRHLAVLCRGLAPPWGPGRGWGAAGRRGVLGLEAGADPATAAANLAAVLITDPELRAGRVLDERLFWLYGPEAAERLRQLAGGGVPAAADHPGAGLTGLFAIRGGQRLGVWLRTGPRGQPPGGEAQALALCLCLDGKALLPPPGPPGSGPLAGHLASRQAHSAVVVDGAEPGPGVVELESLTGSFCAASFDGYRSLADPVRLRRRVYLDAPAGLVTVVDQVQGSGQHQCEVLFHLPAGSRARAGAGGVELTGPWGRALFTPDPKARVEVVSGRDQPPLGWQSLAGGRVGPAPVVRVWAPVVGSARLTNVFALAP
jgi:hypothetical protein